MKGYFLTYKEFSRMVDYWRLKCTKRPRLEKPWKIMLYPFALLAFCFLYLMFAFLVAAAKQSAAKRRKYPYRYSDEYRKVIKEGVFFDTTEYHQK